MADKTMYEVAVHGCDDSTYIFIELNSEEAKGVERVANKVTETSNYQCMPIMEINIK